MSTSRTQKSTTARRQEILAAALELFRSRGFDATTVAGIASAAGVATGTVYLYFDSKEHVLSALHEEFHAGLSARFAALTAQLFERVAAGEDLDHADAVDLLVDELVAYSAEHREACEVIVRFNPRLQTSEVEALHRQFDEQLAHTLDIWTRAGKIHVSDPPVAAQLLHAAMRETVGTAVVHGDDEALQRLAVQAKELFRKTLAPQR